METNGLWGQKSHSALSSPAKGGCGSCSKASEGLNKQALQSDWKSTQCFLAVVVEHKTGRGISWELMQYTNQLMRVIHPAETAETTMPVEKRGWTWEIQQLELANWRWGQKGWEAARMARLAWTSQRCGGGKPWCFSLRQSPGAVANVCEVWAFGI